jgi:hypothetical protein
MTMTTERMIADETRDRPPFGAMFSIGAIMRANAETGSHFFDRDTMRFFGSRVLDGVIGGRFFITGERSGFDHGSPRMYTVREFMPDGSIETVGDFNGYASPAAARRAARELAKSDEPGPYYFDVRHGKNGRRRTYVVHGAVDPWAAMEKLHKNARILHCGRAQDYMLNEHRDHYTHLQA